jgi:hypothetical protein
MSQWGQPPGVLGDAKKNPLPWEKGERIGGPSSRSEEVVEVVTV